MNIANYLQYRNAQNTDEVNKMIQQTRPIKVLIIDDEKSFTSIVKSYFEETANYQVREENKGTRAVSSAKEFGPDIILLDINIPDLPGGEVAAMIKNEPTLKDIPIIFVTALIRKHEENAIKGQRYVAKPVQMEELMKRIEMILPQSTTMRRAGHSHGRTMNSPYTKRFPRKMHRW